MVVLEIDIKSQIIERNSFVELLTLSAELNIVDFNTISIENIKKHVTDSRIDYLTHKYSAVSGRNKHLLKSQKQHKLTNERLKTRYKNCSKTFGKCKSAEINKMEHSECGCVIQLTSQQITEHDIMKETSIGSY